ncbi:MAG TPA: FkbM family methyltransferase [bacterium]|nr:FkbM family methyltransferase [bacterium]HPP11668.1 FkbM family methyltransferase [bacterium]
MNWKQYLSCWGTVLRTIRRNYLGKRLEPECLALKHFVGAESICFDVGAAQGRYTLVLSQLATAGHVYSFEPGDYFFRVLRAIHTFYRLKNVTLVKAAAGKRSGKARLTIPLKKNRRLGYSLAHLKCNQQEEFLQQEVKVISLDDFCQERGLERVDFIKCDVEGAELLVFQGAQKIIEKSRPVILCELCQDYLTRFGATTEKVRQFFLGLGYLSYIWKDGLKAVTNLDGNGNFFFIHSDRKDRGPLGGRKVSKGR